MATLLNKFKKEREAENSPPSFQEGALTEDKINRIINKYSKGKSPLNAKDYLKVSTEIGVPVDLLLAQGIQESNFGTAGRAVRTKNVGNVGNVDSGASRNMNSWLDGLMVQAKLLKKEYGVNSSKDVERLITKGFVRPKDGARYASDKNYEKVLSKLLKEISGSDFKGYSSNGATVNSESNIHSDAYTNQLKSMAESMSKLSGMSMTSQDIERMAKAEGGLDMINAQLLIGESQRKDREEQASLAKIQQEALEEEQQQEQAKKQQEQEAYYTALQEEAKVRDMAVNSYAKTFQERPEIDPAIFSSGQPTQFQFNTRQQFQQKGGFIEKAFNQPNLLSFKQKYKL